MFKNSLSIEIISHKEKENPFLKLTNKLDISQD